MLPAFRRKSIIDVVFLRHGHQTVVCPTNAASPSIVWYAINIWRLVKGKYGVIGKEILTIVDDYDQCDRGLAMAMSRRGKVENLPGT
jgi:hypothetical protein